MILVRVDANPIIGSGHVMRCLSVANELKRYGQEVVFVTADHHIDNVIMSQGFKAICLDTCWEHMEDELPKLIKLISEWDIPLIIVDSYYVTEQYLKTLRNLVKVILFDDLNQLIYPVDMIINYNINALQSAYEVEDDIHPKLLLGCSYIPLREEFSQKKRNHHDHVQNVLVSTGGADQFNILEPLLKKLQAKKEFSNIKFHAVIGPLNPHLPSLENQYKESNRIILHHNVTAMSKLMVSCDAAISAGGSTLYELCACAVPTVSFSYADNQMPGVLEFDRRNLIEYAGDYRENAALCLERMVEKLEKLCKDSKLRTSLSTKMQELVDGDGTRRITEEVLILLEVMSI